MTAGKPGSRLPGWLRTAFWCAVTLEWAVGLALVASLGWAIWCIGFTPPCTCDNGTVYSRGYSEASWAQVQRGDTQIGVSERLGEPLEHWAHADDEWWSYSKQRSGTDDYKERKVRFNREGVVIEKHEECYVD